jgi:hypothetical protein
MKNLEFRIKNEELKTVGCQFRFSILNSQFLILCVSVLFCSVAMADSLKFKFAPSDKYSLVSVTEQKISRIVDGNELSSEQTTRLECDLNVEEVDENGVAWTRYTYKRVTMKLQSKGQGVEFDSDANESKVPIAALPFQMALGESIYLRITPQGHIDKINGLPSLITTAKSKMGDFSGADMVKREIGRQYDEPAVRRMLEDQLMVFPDSNNEGMIWSRREVLSSADVGYAPASERIEDVNIVFEKTFRLNAPAARQGGISVVDVNLTVQPEVSYTRASELRRLASQGEAAEAASLKPSREISGNGAGQIEIENTTGRIISNKMTRDMVEKVKMATQSQMLRPMSGPEPIITHKVTTFQMTKITESKPVLPADTNEKGAPST